MTPPQLISIQVGLPQQRGTEGSKTDKVWQSGIFKFPVEGRVWLGEMNLEGDGQADLHNHGGSFRAVLSYAESHYPVWRHALKRPDFPYGGFGENFTISGLDEDKVCIGDIYAIGDEVRVQVSQPRMPCWKLSRRWGIDNLEQLVMERAWGGWYSRVLQTGYVEAGMPVTRLERPHPDFPVSHVFALRMQWMDVPEDVAELAHIEALTPEWRERFARWAVKSG